jgi:hypothetical protein
MTGPDLLAHVRQRMRAAALPSMLYLSDYEMDFLALAAVTVIVDECARIAVADLVLNGIARNRGNIDKS